MDGLVPDIPLNLKQLANNVRPRALAPKALRRLSRLAKQAGQSEQHRKLERAIELYVAGGALAPDEYATITRGALASIVPDLADNVTAERVVFRKGEMVSIPPSPIEQAALAGALVSIHKALSPVERTGVNNGVAIQINIVQPGSTVEAFETTFIEAHQPADNIEAEQ